MGLYFKELRITPNGGELRIHAGVESGIPFMNVELDKIVIDTQSTYVKDGPSSKPVYEYQVQSGDVKDCKLVLTKDELVNIPMSSTLFFVYVISKGSSTSSQFEPRIMGTAANLYPYMQQMMTFVKEIGDNCCIPKGFIDKFLRYKALDLSIRTGNYPLAIKYWNRFFTGKLPEHSSTKCSCNG